MIIFIFLHPDHPGYWLMRSENVKLYARCSRGQLERIIETFVIGGGYIVNIISYQKARSIFKEVAEGKMTFIP